MLERILRHRIDRALVNHLGREQRAQCRVEIVAVDLDHRLQQWSWELLADHRRRVQHLFLAIAEAVDTRREQRLHGRRNLHGSIAVVSS